MILWEDLVSEMFFLFIIILLGRLDMETRGLLLLSMDGQLTQALLHPKREVEREYCAWGRGRTAETLIETLRVGVQTSLGLAKALSYRLKEIMFDWL